MTIGMAAVIDGATLREARAAIFQRKETTLDAEATRHGFASMAATLLALREEMQALVEALPEAAFAPRPAGADGEQAWCVGEIVTHTCDAQVNIFGRAVRQFAGLGPGVSLAHSADNRGYPTPVRAEALALLRDCTDELRQSLAAFPGDVDLRQEREAEGLGTSTLGATLLIFCIHEDDHLGQLCDLAAE